MAEAPQREDTDVVVERVFAQIVDNFVASLAAFIAGGTFIGIAIALQSVNETFSGIIALVGVLVFLLTVFGYEPFLEYRWRGQTVGKKALGIKAVKENGEEIGGREALLRNLPIIGFIVPYFGLVSYPTALIAIGSSDKRQRVFDKVAETVVIEE